MKNCKLKICVAVLLSFGILKGYAQQAITATGGDASGSGGSVSYSVGQVVYIANSGSGGSVNQGVQQPYEIYYVGIKETTIDITLNVFPNPTKDILTLQVSDFNKTNLSYSLFDMQSKLIESKQIAKKQTQIDMSNLPCGTYFIKVNQKNKKVQTFKIIKN